MKKVQILLSTYNGERYLNEQIQSLLNQKGIQVDILIRDDGSNEETKFLLHKYNDLPEIKVVYGYNIGVVKSYFELIQSASSEYDYFAFCDQDDVWLENKILLAVKALSAEDDEKPLLYTCCAEIVDEYLQHIDYLKQPTKGFFFYNAMIENVIPGNTMVFNNKMRELLARVQKADNIVMHDHFTYILASAFGKILFDKEPTIRYRQHPDNAVGMKKDLFPYIKTKVHTVFSGKLKRISMQLSYLLFIYGKDLEKEMYSEVEQFLIPKYFFARLKYIFTKKAVYHNFSAGMVFWTLYVFGFISLKNIHDIKII